MSDALPPPPPLPPRRTSSPSGGSANARAGWLLFGLVLIAPAVLTLLTSKSQDLWPIFTFPASGAAGLYCGFWMASRVCRTVPGKILGGLALAAVFAVVSFALCCAGCELGGAQLNLH